MRSLKLTVFLKIKFLLSSFFIMNYFGYVKKNDIASHVFTADRKGQSLDAAAEPPRAAPGPPRQGASSPRGKHDPGSASQALTLAEAALPGTFKTFTCRRPYVSPRPVPAGPTLAVPRPRCG